MFDDYVPWTAEQIDRGESISGGTFPQALRRFLLEVGSCEFEGHRVVPAGDENGMLAATYPYEESIRFTSDLKHSPRLSPEWLVVGGGPGGELCVLLRPGYDYGVVYWVDHDSAEWLGVFDGDTVNPDQYIFELARSWDALLDDLATWEVV